MRQFIVDSGYFVTATGIYRMGYTNSPIGYANPDAVTQIANGLSTTTFTYDNNGNVTQKTVDDTTTTYVYDYDSPPRSSRTGPCG
jgi:YD repeat-containing protein